MFVFLLLGLGATLGVPIVIAMYYAVRYGLDLEQVCAPKRGPEVAAVNVRLPRHVLDRLDAAAKGDGVTRAEKIQQLVIAGI